MPRNGEASSAEPEGRWAAVVARDGFRPCKRCRPRELASQATREAARPIVAMCKMLEERDTAPSLHELAAHVGLSESHAHRLFARTTGLTTKQYRDAIIRERVHGELRASKSVTEAIYAAGFNASSRFYEHVARMLGMQPSE